ncbi:3D domain protein [Haliangium ochraceum DSM 14365]|uniref:3D domain protein n=2 Tax=Haliangium ochraceum TaxID=80816 RepID=D0LTQ0_HALO1|nr:3D domain protein [Haliangium ochraceum DSM 14365]
MGLCLALVAAALLLWMAALVPELPPPAADAAKIAGKDQRALPKQFADGRDKRCCGYPLSEDQGFALRFYWLAEQWRFADAWDEPQQDVYTAEGFYLGTFAESYVRALRMEGSGLLEDGRVVNFAGRCGYGTGTCFEQVDPATHPYGRGAGRRPLVPFRSVAIDPRVIDIGEPLYIPEFDGLRLPDGSLHDGCVRADDTGGAIKHRKMDFFVMSFDNFRFLLDKLWGVTWITPHVETPRCDYLRDR